MNIKRINALIADNDLLEAIKVLEDENISKDDRNTLLNLKRSLSALDTAKQKGTINQVDARQERNEIGDRLIDIVSKYEGSTTEQTKGPVIVGLRAYKKENASVFEKLQR
ncbi:MAG: hypothetical protein AAGC85_24885, partial [Bacteroidota bacterium]